MFQEYDPSALSKSILGCAEAISIRPVVFIFELDSIEPVIVPPAFGSAAPAVVVVLVSTASRAAMSTPSTVPDTPIFPVTFILLLKSHSSFASSHKRLALEPSTTIPEPPEAASFCPAPKVIVWSVTSKSVTDTVFKSPVTFMFPVTFISAKVGEAVVATLCPILIAPLE